MLQIIMQIQIKITSQVHVILVYISHFSMRPSLFFNPSFLKYNLSLSSKILSWTNTDCRSWWKSTKLVSCKIQPARVLWELLNHRSGLFLFFFFLQPELSEHLFVLSSTSQRFHLLNHSPLDLPCFSQSNWMWNQNMDS